MLTVLPAFFPQALPGSARGEAGDLRSVRWAVWSPVPGAGDAEVVLPLRGGACRSPCQALVYQSPVSGRSFRQVRGGFCTTNTRRCCPWMGRLDDRDALCQNLVMGKLQICVRRG